MFGIPEFIAGKITDAAFSQLVEYFVGSVEDQIATVLSAIQDLGEKLDRQLLIPLHSGLTYVQLGQWNDALREFIHANAAEPLSPVAKLWLALTLRHLGKGEDATPYFKQSARLNPFVLPMMGEIADKLGDAASGTVIWKQPLESPSLLAKLPPQPLKIPGYFRRRASTAIRSVSTSGENIVIRWVFGGDLSDRDSEQFITVMKKETGVPLWTLECGGWNLAFASPDVVFLSADPVAREFRVIDARSGGLLRSVSESYFRSYFVPGPGYPTVRNAFNCDLWPLSVAYKETTGKKLSWFRQLAGFTHDIKDVKESLSVPLFIDPTLRLLVENAWTHAHVAYGHYARACGLWGEATISLLKTATKPAKPEPAHATQRRFLSGRGNTKN
jgi:hypothetical protein